MTQPDLDLSSILEACASEARKQIGQGRVADYIPALARINPHQFGMAVCGVDGTEWSTGDSDTSFSIQSISKVFTLALALQSPGAAGVWDRVGREPSGTAFNSLFQLEAEQGLPRNPFINAGAIVITDVITNHFVSPVLQILGLVRKYANCEQIYIDEEVARSEAESGHRNAAIAHLLKSQGNLAASVEDVLAAYYRQCSIAMTCRDVARAFLPLAAGGRHPLAEREGFEPSERLRAQRFSRPPRSTTPAPLRTQGCAVSQRLGVKSSLLGAGT
jgi:glutaminase